MCIYIVKYLRSKLNMEFVLKLKTAGDKYPPIGKKNSESTYINMNLGKIECSVNFH